MLKLCKLLHTKLSLQVDQSQGICQSSPAVCKIFVQSKPLFAKKERKKERNRNKNKIYKTLMNENQPKPFPLIWHMPQAGGAVIH